MITPEELKTLQSSDKIVIIDTRDPESYAAGHIPGAVNMHDIFTYLATSTVEGFKELTDKFAEEFGKAGLSGEETAVIYEASMNTGFGQSCRGYYLLQYLGYPKATILHGGYQAWSAAGGEISQSAPEITAKEFTVKPEAASIMVDVSKMLEAIKDPNTVLLDVRDVDEWIGESSSPYGKDFCPRKGRIPGAVWIEWYRMMKPGTSGPMMKTKEELLAECSSVGIKPGMNVIIYCFKGARASNTFVALKEAGIENVSIYFGSWNEWSRDPELPIEAGYPYAA